MLKKIVGGFQKSENLTGDIVLDGSEEFVRLFDFSMTRVRTFSCSLAERFNEIREFPLSVFDGDERVAVVLGADAPGTNGNFADLTLEICRILVTRAAERMA